MSEAEKTTATIYVDSPAIPGGRCHMAIAVDGDLEQLHRFAEHIGVHRKWFHATSAIPNYYLTPHQKVKALRAGAVEASPLEFIRYCNKATKQ